MSCPSIDFAARVKIADALLIVSKRVARLLKESPLDDSELAMAKSMVEMRDLLASIRDDLGGREHGPTIQLVDKEADSGFAETKAFEYFAEGFATIAMAYSEIQQARSFDVDWSEAAKQITSLRNGIVQLVSFQAVAYAYGNNKSLPVARQQLQLAMDRRLTSSPATSADNKELLPEHPAGITARELAETFDALPRQIRDLLVEKKIPVIVKGNRSRAYKWTWQEARKCCGENFKQKPVGASSIL